MKINLVWHEAGNELYYDRYIALAEKCDLTVYGFTSFMGKIFPVSNKNKHQYLLKLYKPWMSSHWLTVFSPPLITSLIKSKAEVIYIHEEPHSLLAFFICLFCLKKKIYLDCAVINNKLNFKKLN